MTESKRDIGSDLAKVDAYQLTAADYDEIPEATEADFARATLNKGGVPVPRGRPALGDKAKKQVTLRLDPNVITHFRAGGAGWQIRINSWLAARQDVVDLIATYEASVGEMRILLVQLKDPTSGLRALKPDQAKSIEMVERQIVMTENAAIGVRKVLNEQALLGA